MLKRAALLTLPVLLACSTRDKREPDSGARRAEPTQATFDAARRAAGIDTTTAAYIMGSMMSAPINADPIDAYEGDTLQWFARADSCAMIVRAAGPTARGNPKGGWWMYVSEAGSTIGPANSLDVSASPDFRNLVYTITSSKGTFAIVPLANDCMGEDCPDPIVREESAVSQTGWTADSRYLLLLGRDSSRWRSFDPRTLEPAGVDGATPAPIRWMTFPISASATASPREITAGKFTFASRNDSLFVRGPNRDGFETTRFVGPGIPVTASGHGHFLTAVRREKNGLRGVLYIFRVDSPAITLACNPG